MRSQIFHDFEAFADSVRDVDSKMLLRNPQRRVWFTCSVDLGQIDVQLGRLGSGNIAQGQLRADGYMVYLPLTNGVEYSANGRVLENGSFAVLEPGCEFCISTKVEHDWCVAFVPSSMFAQLGDLVSAPSGVCRVTRPHRQAADNFRSIVFELLNTAASCADFESSPAVSHAVPEVVKAVSGAVGLERVVEPVSEGRPRIPRQEIMRRCMELIAHRTSNSLSVGELTTVANVSERTLRTAFKEHFGVGPARYLQLKLLHEVYRTLRAADPNETSVGEILIAHEEWAFSRFASRYRQLFGELPSETLRSKKRN